MTSTTTQQRGDCLAVLVEAMWGATGGPPSPPSQDAISGGLARSQNFHLHPVVMRTPDKYTYLSVAMGAK